MKSTRIVTHFTTRMDGTSEFPFAKGNLGLHVGDDPERVIANRAIAAQQIGLPLDTWVAGDQVHGSTVTVVTAEMRGRGARERADLLPATDALITQVAGITLSTYAADCVPLLFADEEHQAIGVAHAGWQGTVVKIAAKTVQAMAAAYGTNPAHLQVKIGPSIGPCCYEVDEPVVSRVRDAFTDESDRLLTQNANGRYQLDMREASVAALLEAGVRPENIHREDPCTACNIDRYFSHRKEKGKTGRHAGLIALLQEK